ncbi:9308_t:CDS:1, partial [Scutellospora calospora]
YVKCPLNLILTCNDWHDIAKNNDAKAEWVICNYGRAHSLFHAVRLGPSFIDQTVAHAIITKGGILTRYFMQRLLVNYGSYDIKLIELKITHNVKQIDAEQIKALQKKARVPWASDLPLPVFTYFLTVAQTKFKPQELYLKGNDMELFHFFSAGPHVIKDAPNILQKNMGSIEDLILHKKFIPFPPRPSRKFTDLCTPPNIPEEYPSKDGYENNRQLNVIARAILICKNLVSLWKKIGYHEICGDVNDLVIQGQCLLFFPPNFSAEWTLPDISTINKRFTELINVGFHLSYNLIGKILYLFEDRLEDIGKILVESFIYIKQDNRENFLNQCIIESLRSEHCSSKHQVWNFLYSIVQNPEFEFIKAFNHYLRKNENFIINSEIKKLLLPSKFYIWVLKKFGTDAQITKLCFEDILKARVSIDKEQQSNININVDIPRGINQHVYHSICNIFKVYCNAKNFYQPSHLDIISLCTSTDILAPLFRYYLPDLFNIEITFQLPMQTVEDIDDIDNDDEQIFPKSTTKKKRKKQILNQWDQSLCSISANNNGRTTNSFRNYLHEFLYEKLPNSDFAHKKSRILY